MNNSSQNLLSSAINLFFRDAKTVLFVWILCIVVAVAAALLLPKIYEAKSTLLVKFGREYIYRAETGDQQSTTAQRSGMEEVINSEVQILASRDLKQNVITSIGLDRLYPDLVPAESPTEDAIMRLSSALSIRSIDRSSIINLYLQHNDPVIAADALNKLVDLFTVKRLEVYRNSDVPFFEGQVHQLTTELRGSEEGFATFKARNKIFELDGQSRLLVEQRNSLSTAFSAAERNISELSQQQSSLGQQLGNLPETIVLYRDSEQGRMLDEARSTLFSLRLEEKQLLGAYREDSKAVQNVRYKIKQIEELLTAKDKDVSGMSVRTGPNKIYQTVREKQLRIDTELSSMKARRKTIVAQIDKVESEIIRMSSLNSKHDELARDIESKRRTLQAQLTNLADAQAFAALDDQNKTNIRVVQAAIPPTHATGLTRKAKVMLSIPFGLLAGLLTAFCLNLFRTTVSEAITVERKSGLEVLATRTRSD